MTPIPETASAEMDRHICALIMGRCGPDYRRLSDTGEIWYHTMQGRAFVGRPYQIEEGGKWDHQWERFEPSTRIEHAFEVVEKLRDRVFHLARGLKGRWHVHIDGMMVVEVHESLPMCICLAALRAVGEAWRGHQNSGTAKTGQTAAVENTNEHRARVTTDPGCRLFLF